MSFGKSKVERFPPVAKTFPGSNLTMNGGYESRKRNFEVSSLSTSLRPASPPLYRSTPIKRAGRNSTFTNTTSSSQTRCQMKTDRVTTITRPNHRKVILSKPKCSPTFKNGAKTMRRHESCIPKSIGFPCKTPTNHEGFEASKPKRQKIGMTTPAMPNNPLPEEEKSQSESSFSSETHFEEELAVHPLMESALVETVLSSTSAAEKADDHEDDVKSGVSSAETTITTPFRNPCRRSQTLSRISLTTPPSTMRESSLLHQETAGVFNGSRNISRRILQSPDRRHTIQPNQARLGAIVQRGVSYPLARDFITDIMDYPHFQTNHRVSNFRSIPLWEKLKVSLPRIFPRRRDVPDKPDESYNGKNNRTGSSSFNQKNVCRDLRGKTVSNLSMEVADVRNHSSLQSRLRPSLSRFKNKLWFEIALTFRVIRLLMREPYLILKSERFWMNVLELTMGQVVSIARESFRTS